VDLLRLYCDLGGFCDYGGWGVSDAISKLLQLSDGDYVRYDDVVKALQHAPQHAVPEVDADQQLVEAVKKAESHLVAMMAHIEQKPWRFQEHCWQQVLEIREALNSAGKENNND
jgi:hypothetical protein